MSDSLTLIVKINSCVHLSMNDRTPMLAVLSAALPTFAANWARGRRPDHASASFGSFLTRGTRGRRPDHTYTSFRSFADTGTQGRRLNHACTSFRSFTDTGDTRPKAGSCLHVALVTILHIKIMIRNVLISVSLTPAAVAHLSHRPIAKCFYQL